MSLFYFTARWFTQKERQRRELGLWGANKKKRPPPFGHHHQDAAQQQGSVAQGAIGSRGLVAMGTPRVAYLENFMYCLHVSVFFVLLGYVHFYIHHLSYLIHTHVIVMSLSLL
jgi:hypothetical protein